MHTYRKKGEVHYLNKTRAEWEVFFPLSQLPPLHQRSFAYFVEPWTGLCVTGVFCCIYTSAVYSFTPPDDHYLSSFQRHARGMMLLWVSVAVASTVYLVFGGAGEIQRSATTCYPIPDVVLERLRRGEDLCGWDNLSGPTGSKTLGSYCVRCLLWRPPKNIAKPHHCDTCQRCVLHFDHHCGVFGRCIVRGNMPCYCTIIFMFFTGWITVVLATG